MADLYSDIPELSAEAQANARRRKIAEAMMQQGQAPLESMGMAGGAPIPISWTQGLAKLAQAYMGGKQVEDVETADKSLAERHTGMQTSETQRIADVISGRPETQAPFQADNPFGEDLGTNTTVTPAVAPGGRDAVQAALLESKMPGFRDAGLKMMLTQSEQQGQMQQMRDILKGTQAPAVPVAPQGSTVDFRGNIPQAISEMNRISDPAIRADAQAALASQNAPVGPTTPVFKSGGLTEEQAIALSTMVGNPAAVTLGKTALAGIEKQRAEYNRSQDRKEGREETFANQNFMQQQAIDAANERAALDRQVRTDAMGEKVEAKAEAANLKQTETRYKDQASLTAVNTLADNLRSNIESLIGKDGKTIHPGLPGATGNWQGTGVGGAVSGAMSQDVADAQAILKSIEAQLSVEGMSNIRQIASSPGTVTEKEWPRFENINKPIGRTQDTPVLANQLASIRNGLDTLQKDASDRFNQRYGSVASGAAGGVDRRAPPATPAAVQTATGANGQKLYLRDGQWVPK